MTAIADNTRFTIGTNNSSQTPLPVELISFEAQLDTKEIVDITWSTASEINNHFFEVQRSEDGKNWEVVQYVEGAGNSKSVLSYTTVDVLHNKDVYYYRLRQVDFNVTEQYSKVITVNNQEVRSTDVMVYPIPSKDLLTI